MLNKEEPDLTKLLQRVCTVQEYSQASLQENVPLKLLRHVKWTGVKNPILKFKASRVNYFL